MILDVTALTEATGELSFQERTNPSEKSISVIYDSDEAPPSPPRRGSLSYSSSRSREGKKNANAKNKRKSGLFCCMVRNVSKRHLPTP